MNGSAPAYENGVGRPAFNSAGAGSKDGLKVEVKGLNEVMGGLRVLVESLERQVFDLVEDRAGDFVTKMEEAGWPDPGLQVTRTEGGMTLKVTSSTPPLANEYGTLDTEERPAMRRWLQDLQR